MAHTSRDDIMQAALSASEAMQKQMHAYFMQCITEKTQERPGAHLGALHLIKLHGPLSSRKLGEILHITPGAVTQFVNSLVEEGLVERTPSLEDRRVINLAVTEAGEEKIKRLHAFKRQVFRELYTVLSDEELTNYLAIQQKMTAQLQKMHHDKSEAKGNK